MANVQSFAVLGLLVLTICFCLQLQSSAISEDTLVSSFVLLLTIGLAIKAGIAVQARSTNRPSIRRDDSIPVYKLAGGKSASAGRLDSLRRLGLIDLDPARETVFIVLTAALSLRIELTRNIVRNIGCAGISLTPLLPIIVAAGLYLAQPRDQRPLTKPEKTRLPRHNSTKINLSTRITSASVLLLIPPCVAALFTLRAFTSPRSTYICATSSPLIWMISLLQHYCTALDAVLLFYLAKVAHSAIANTREVKLSVLKLVSSVFIVSACLLLFCHGIYYLIMHPFLPKMPLLSIPYLWSLAKLTPFVAAFAIFAMNTILAFDVIFTSTLVTVLVAATTTITHLLGSSAMTYSHTAGLAAVFVMLVSFASVLRAKVQALQAGSSTGSGRRNSYGWSIAYFAVSLVFGTFVFSRVHRTMLISEHPVLILMQNAQSEHTALLVDAKSSNHVLEAMENYSSRYGRLPPPGFDEWYRFAAERNSTFVDNFDQIYQDLLPFYGLEPRVIRERTFELIANPWNGVSAISIRHGQAHLGPRIGSTDLPMMEGLKTIINKFAKHLPDMDIAFNLYDEPRVAVPYERMHYLKEMAHLHEIVHESQIHFQPGRSIHWPHLDEQGESNAVMREVAYHAVWEQFATVSCPPSSPARRQHYWDRAAACLKCSEPHSADGMLSNLTLAADICYQPDLANLHGFFMAQDAYKGTNKLYPVFSTAKLAGFNDILYPGFGAYQDAEPGKLVKMKDTAWADKTSDLFWRGTTNEGISYGDRQWEGMMRQRFVHLANNIKGTSPAASILLPRTAEGLAYEYHDIGAADIQRLLRADVQIAPDITKCRNLDCDVQRWEFAPVPDSASLAEVLEHKFPLVMDDRERTSVLLALLRSSSTPFSAGIFRQWWTHRVTPWLHFVPLDIRGHGLWNTLAYFTGLEGEIQGKPVSIPAHDEEARNIGEAGKTWAAQTLRQDDMEVYLFRLLLEWGRMTDDWRDEIGLSWA